MKKEDLENMSTDELLKRQKSLKTITGMLAGILLLLFGITIFKSVKDKTFDVMMVVPISLSGIVLINYKLIKDITNELKSR